MNNMTSLNEKAARLLRLCRDNGVMLTTAESCTGGMIAAAITDIPGSSDVFERGFVTYSNKSKTELLDVPVKLIENKGAVSEEVAIAMAEGAIRNSAANLAASVTGIAGPSGGTKEKPVGLVYIAICKKNTKTTSFRYNFAGSRDYIRKKTTDYVLSLLIEAIK